jgi:small subunit ribosomal protein S27e
MTLCLDVLNPSRAHEAKTHKLKRLVQSPDSYFMDVKCAACQHINILFSHADTSVTCTKCKMVLCQPTGGLARLSEGVSFRKKPQ